MIHFIQNFQRMFDKFSAGNFYLREWGTPEQGTARIGKDWGTRFDFAHRPHKKQ
jgi:hypothetical protein